MEHVISMEEILGPFWELLPPPAPEPASMVVGGTLSATEMNRVAAATHCAGAMELIQTAMGSMPPTSASGSTPPPQDYELLGPNGAIHMDMY
ncbi:Regulatory protein opaque-2 [Zea mays]|uniref:Regulatory protein opaque-2 n=1 Tax=Zea mays TaxID=4577 RepID=A0A1D6HTP6_MAIZE|nr:Regulatory protein opaque-2 [Zea mays]